jgi:hypothetical protein
VEGLYDIYVRDWGLRFSGTGGITKAINRFSTRTIGGGAATCAEEEVRV